MRPLTGERDSEPGQLCNAHPRCRGVLMVPVNSQAVMEKPHGFPWFSKENHLEIGYNWWVFIDLVRYHRITGLGVTGLGGPEI